MALHLIQLSVVMTSTIASLLPQSELGFPRIQDARSSRTATRALKHTGHVAVGCALSAYYSL